LFTVGLRIYDEVSCKLVNTNSNEPCSMVYALLMFVPFLHNNRITKSISWS